MFLSSGQERHPLKSQLKKKKLSKKKNSNKKAIKAKTGKFELKIKN